MIKESRGYKKQKDIVETELELIKILNEFDITGKSKMKTKLDDAKLLEIHRKVMEMDKYDIREYATVYSDVFAIALHRVFGYQICVVRGYFHDKDSKIKCYEDSHVLTRVGNIFIDAEGITDGKTIFDTSMFNNKIEKTSIIDITEKEARYIFTLKKSDEYLVQKAINFIEENKSDYDILPVKEKTNSECLISSNNKHFEYAIPLSHLKQYITNLMSPINDNILKILLFSSARAIPHWEKKIKTFLIGINNIKSKRTGRNLDKSAYKEILYEYLFENGEETYEDSTIFKMCYSLLIGFEHKNLTSQYRNNHIPIDEWKKRLSSFYDYICDFLSKGQLKDDQIIYGAINKYLRGI